MNVLPSLMTWGSVKVLEQAACVCGGKFTCVFHAVTPIIGLAMVVVVFGYLLSIFRMKYGGYPYRFVGGVVVQVMKLCAPPSSFLFR